MEKVKIKILVDTVAQKKYVKAGKALEVDAKEANLLCGISRAKKITDEEYQALLDSESEESKTALTESFQNPSDDNGLGAPLSDDEELQKMIEEEERQKQLQSN